MVWPWFLKEKVIFALLMFPLLDLSGFHKITCHQMIKIFQVLIFLTKPSYFLMDTWKISSWRRSMAQRVVLLWSEHRRDPRSAEKSVPVLGECRMGFISSTAVPFYKVVCIALPEIHNPYVQREFIRRGGRETLKTNPEAMLIGA